MTAFAHDAGKAEGAAGMGMAVSAARNTVRSEDTAAARSDAGLVILSKRVVAMLEYPDRANRGWSDMQMKRLRCREASPLSMKRMVLWTP